LKRYLRLFVLLVVLTLSVGMLSSAINILGDITRLDLDEGSSVSSMGLAEAQSLSGGEQQAEVGFEQQSPKGPVIMIRFSTRNKYLRRYAAYNYSHGFWNKPADLEAFNYNGQYFPMDPTWPRTYTQVQFQVNPLVNLTGHILTAQNTDNIRFNTSLIYYEEIQSFVSIERYDDPYWVSYKLYEYSDAALKASRSIGPPEALNVPDDLVLDFTILAERVVEGESTDYGKLVAIRAYLLENYEWNEEFTPAPSMIDPIRWFLYNEKAGVGSHFNSAFIMLARSLGIPMRAVIGYTVDDQMELQYVMPQQAYMWAETEFENLGWVTIDASPRNLMDSDVNVTKQTTVTNITGSDPIAIRGKQFNVWGTVETLNGTVVKESQVEVMVKVNKTDLNETALIVGVGFVNDGLFNVTCDVTPEIRVGDYNLIAHTLETINYRESWSDPPIKVMAETIVKITGPRQVYQGKNITYMGSIFDASDGSPVVNASLNVNYLSQKLTLTSDADGKVSFNALFPDSGKTNMSLGMPMSIYYLGSETNMGITVIIPPPDTSNIISLFFTFPYNIGVALSVSIGVGFYAAKRNRRIQEEALDEEPQSRVLSKREYIGYEDGVPLEYTSYEEGVVKLFNRFYVSMQRIYPDIDETMTPREFQFLLLEKLPMHADALLEDLVSNYEIAMYSNIALSQEDFKQTNATIELLIELMKIGNRD
jgi:transglutaminase-like putative cysteine protease